MRRCQAYEALSKYEEAIKGKTTKNYCCQYELFNKYYYTTDAKELALLDPSYPKIQDTM